MKSPKVLARTAGALYVLFAALGVFAHLFVRDRVHVAGDAAATAGNIVADATMFRLAFVADIAMATLFVAVGVVLYRLLNHVDRRSAGAMVVFVAVGAAMILVNLIFHYAALLVATDPVYATALGVEGTDGLVLLLVDMHHHGYTIAGIFFGLWLLPLGYLAYKSEMLPRVLGVLVLIAGASWIVHTLTTFLAPDLPDVVHVLMTAPTFAEFLIFLYLLVVGVRLPGQTEPVRTAS